MTVDCVTRDRAEAYDEEVDDDPQDDDEAVERWPIVSADVCGGRVEPQPMLRPWSLFFFNDDFFLSTRARARLLPFHENIQRNMKANQCK